VTLNFFSKNKNKITCVFIFYVGPMDVEVDSGEKVGIEHDKRVVEGHQ
jgi:hypothetical protein